MKCHTTYKRRSQTHGSCPNIVLVCLLVHHQPGAFATICFCFGRWEDAANCTIKAEKVFLNYNSHIKMTGMLVVPFRGQNYGFGSTAWGAKDAEIFM